MKRFFAILAHSNAVVRGSFKGALFALNIIIAGDGKVGVALTRLLSLEGHELVAIDSNARVLAQNLEQYDVMTVQGNCATMAALREAGVEQSDLLIAATSADEINLLCCLTARKMNPSLHTIARVRSPEYYEQLFSMREEFGLSLTINPELTAAQEITRLLQFPGFLKRETFAKGRVEIVELRVLEGSLLENISLSSLQGVLGCKVLVCAIVRGGQALIPTGNAVLQRGDHIYVTAPVAVLAHLLKRLGITHKRTRHAMLIGGSRVCYYLAKSLIDVGMQVKIIEQDERRCVELAQLLPEASIIQADGSSQETLDSEGLDTTDALVTLTGLDELNVVMAMYAGARGVPLIVTKVNRIETTGLLENLNIGSVISPKELCSATIVQYVRAMQNQTGAAVSVHLIAGGQVEALEFRVTEETRNLRTPLRDIRLKSNILISCITRRAKTILPDGGSHLEPGDTVIVVTGRETPLLQLNDIFE